MADTVLKRISVTRAISFVALVTIIFVIGFLFYRVMARFLVPLFLAALLVVIFRPLHLWFLERCGGRSQLAAGLTTTTILLIVLAPIGLVIFMAVSEGVSLSAEMDVRMLQQRLKKLQQRLGIDSAHAEALRKINDGLDELQHLPTASPEFQHRTVGQLLERVVELEGKLSSTLVSSVPDEANAIPDQEFEERSGELIGELKAALEALRLPGAEPGSLAAERALNDAQTALRRLKQHLLGGPYRAWLTDIANPSEDDLRELRNRAFEQFQGGLLSLGAATGAATVKLVIGLVILVLALYFFLADGPAMLLALMRLSPLDDQYEKELLDEFIKISRAVVVATLLSALSQGVLAGFGFWVAGVRAVFLLASITAVFALIPFVGAWSVWAPVCLYVLFYEERPLAAGLLALYGAVIVSTADNVVKALVLHGQSRLHPLLALLSVLGGVAALGPIGILIGPMVVVFLQTLLNIMQRELAAIDERLPAPDPDEAALGPPTAMALSTAGSPGGATVAAAPPQAPPHPTGRPPAPPPRGKRARRRNRK